MGISLTSALAFHSETDNVPNFSFFTNTFTGIDQLHLGKRQHSTSYVVDRCDEALLTKEVKSDPLPLFTLPSSPRNSNKTKSLPSRDPITKCASLVDTLISDLVSFN